MTPTAKPRALLERPTRAYGLLAALLALLTLAPALDESRIGGAVLTVILCGIFVLSVLVLEDAGVWRRRLLALAAATALLHVAAEIGSSSDLLLAGYVAAVFLLTGTAARLLQRVVTAEVVDESVIVNAISTYLLIGALWAFLFMMMHHMDPTAFDFEADGRLTPYLYLSFMTLTTLGYGDVTSDNGYVRIWSSVEAIVGVFFQAIVIARLVSLYKQP